MPGKASSFGRRHGGAALITGASGGIGEAFARRLAKDGTDLVLVARRRDRLEALARELAGAHGVATHVLALDLIVPDATELLVDFVRTRQVDVGMLVLNAGFGVPGLLHEADPDRLVAMVDLHCKVPVLLLHAFLPAMVARGKGAVIVVASVAGYQLGPASAVYTASKGFDLLLGESLWAELAPLGIDALAVSPGYTRTGFQEAAGISHPGLPDWVWSEADEVAEEALGALGRRASVVPGPGYKVLCALVRLLPRGLLNRMAKPIFFRKLGRTNAEDGRSPGRP